MKKFISILLAVLSICLSIGLVSCSKPQENEKNSVETTAQPTDTTASLTEATYQTTEETESTFSTEKALETVEVVTTEPVAETTSTQPETEKIIPEDISYKYDKDTKTLTITGKGKMDRYFKWKDYSEPSWYYVENPEKLVISDGITNISYNAFSYYIHGRTGEHNDFNKLKTVVLPDSLTEIGGMAFYYCESLSEINIPDSVKKIGKGAFHNTALSEITFGGQIKVVSEDVCEFCEKLKKVTFEEGVEVIEKYAFSCCTMLTNVEFPATLEKLGESAFEGCDSLREVTFKNKNTKIEIQSIGYDCVGDKIKNFTIKGYKGSTAEKYAKENGFKFIEL